MIQSKIVVRSCFIQNMFLKIPQLQDKHVTLIKKDFVTGVFLLSLHLLELHSFEQISHLVLGVHIDE